MFGVNVIASFCCCARRVHPRRVYACNLRYPRLVVSDSTDPDGVGFVQWRVTFYAAGEDDCVMNALCLLDDFFAWKAKAMAKELEAFAAQQAHTQNAYNGLHAAGSAPRKTPRNAHGVLISSEFHYTR